MKRILTMSVVVPIFVSGCAVHNYPATHHTTKLHYSEIVNKVKCEMRAHILLISTEDFGLIEPIVDGNKIFEKYEVLVKQKAGLAKEIEKENLKIKAAQEKLDQVTAEQVDLQTNARAYEALALEIDENTPEPEARKIIANRKKFGALLKVLNEKFIDPKSKTIKVAEAAIRKKEATQKSNSRKLREIEKTYPGYTSFLRSVVKTDFTFTLTETNRARITFAGTWPYKTGTKGLGANAGAPASGSLLDRKSKKLTKISSTVRELHQMDCSRYPSNKVESRTALNGGARIYPIVGEIGAGVFLKEYVEIVASDKVGESKDIFSDTMTFTTDFSSGVDPTVTLAPVTGSTVTIGGIFQQQRKDVHQVAITVVRP